jgi:hypothetical protein
MLVRTKKEEGELVRPATSRITHGLGGETMDQAMENPSTIQASSLFVEIGSSIPPYR